MPELSQQDLTYFSQTIERLAGLYMKPAKQHIIQTRLQKRLPANGLSTYAEYRRFLESLPDSHPEWELFINLLTTNKTDFFREPKHFDFLVRNVLPIFLKSSAKTFKVWSAAASTGEEPYTLAMVLSQHLPPDRDFHILATDIDTQVLATADNGVYPNTKLHEIPECYQKSSVAMGSGSAADWFCIRRKLKEKILFQQHNLIEPSLPVEDKFDLILCRNVMIYFERSTIEKLIRKLHSSAKPGGHLFIGHSESLQAISHSWKPKLPAIFQK